MPYYITVFGKVIPLYGICFYTGIAIAVAVALLITKKRRLPRWEIVYSAIYCMIGAMIGAKLLFLAVSIDEIIQYKLSLLSVIKGGFVFYGGLIGGALGLFIYAWQYKLSLRPYLDVYAVVLPLGHAIGRVGCFFGGCCYGIPYDGPGCVIYEETAGMTPLNVPLLPVQLIEAAALLLLFGMQLYLYYKYHDTKIKALLVWTYAIAYSVIRFVLEYFRGDGIRGKLLWFSTSQWISVVILLGAVAAILIGRKQAGKEQAN